MSFHLVCFWFTFGLLFVYHMLSLGLLWVGLLFALGLPLVCLWFGTGLPFGLLLVCSLPTFGLLWLCLWFSFGCFWFSFGVLLLWVVLFLVCLWFAIGLPSACCWFTFSLLLVWSAFGLLFDFGLLLVSFCFPGRSDRSTPKTWWGLGLTSDYVGSVKNTWLNNRKPPQSRAVTQSAFKKTKQWEYLLLRHPQHPRLPCELQKHNRILSRDIPSIPGTPYTPKFGEAGTGK